MATSVKKPVKKTDKKTPVKKEKVVKESTHKSPSVVEKKVSSRRNFNFPKVSINPLKIAIVLGVIIVASLLYFFQDKYLFAKVNGKPLTNFAVMKEMETVKQNEIAEVVNIMIDKSLILQEAEKRNIVITDQEIDEELKKTEDQLKESGQTLDNQLALLGLTREGLRENYRIQKSIEKMIGQVSVSDEEISKYLEENKDLIPQDQEESQIREMVKEQLTQQKLSEKYQSFISDLRNKADITTFRPYLNQAPVAQ
jgi:foldase protein PrsA